MNPSTGSSPLDTEKEIIHENGIDWCKSHHWLPETVVVFLDLWAPVYLEPAWWTSDVLAWWLPPRLEPTTGVGVPESQRQMKFRRSLGDLPHDDRHRESR